MPRPRKPTALLELNGAFKKNPARALDREDEPQGHDEIGDPPADFCNETSPTSRAKREIWFRFLAEAPEGCITGSDRTLLANACRLQAELERPFAKVTPAMHAQMRRYLADLGMSAPGRAQQGGRGLGGSRPGEGRPVGGDGAWAEVAAERRKSVQ